MTFGRMRAAGGHQGLPGAGKKLPDDTRPARRTHSVAVVTLSTMKLLELHIVAGGIGEEAALLVRQRTRLLHRAADVQVAALQHLARRHQAAGTDDHLVRHHRAVHDDAAHADQDAAAQGAAMQGHLVADGHVVADQQRKTIGVERAGMGDVQHAAILHAGARTDADAVHVATDHRQRPHRAVFAQLDIADDHSAGIDEHSLAKPGGMTLVGTNRHDRASQAAVCPDCN